MLIKDLRQRIKKWQDQDLIRKRISVNKRINYINTICISGNTYIDFSSNDYLGLIKHPKIIKQLKIAIDKYGFGSSSSALVSGFFDSHYDLEIQYAKWLGVDKAILFSSGYLANISVVSTLANRKDTILSDKLCHASILDGIQLSRAKHYRYKHCSIEHLNTLAKSKKPKFIVTESIFSMEGSMAPLSKIIDLADKYKSSTIIDDAHGVGVLGKHGAGICEINDIKQDRFTCLVIPLGKSFNGLGAIVAGRNEIIESILQFSKSYRYTTALPPAICAGLQSALSIIIEEKWRREQLKEIIKFFIFSANERQLQLSSYDETPIKSIIVGDNHKAIYLQKILLSKGFFVAAIRPPAVPNNSARLRISLNCLHTESQIILLLDYINKNIQ